MSLSSRLKEDIAHLCRLIEGELRVYEKQVDLLFTLMNNMAVGPDSESDACPITSELTTIASANKAVSLIDEDMASTVESIRRLIEKIQAKHPGAKCYAFEKQVEAFNRQAILNRAILYDLIAPKSIQNPVTHLSCILHQPVLDLDRFRDLLIIIKSDA